MTGEETMLLTAVDDALLTDRADRMSEEELRRALVRALARIAGKATDYKDACLAYHKVLGAPGDYGYETKLGKALQDLYAATHAKAAG